MSRENTIEALLDILWGQALDAGSMQKEFDTVEDFERAYLKYKVKAKHQAMKAIEREKLKGQIEQVQWFADYLWSDDVKPDEIYPRLVERIFELQAQLEGKE